MMLMSVAYPDANKHDPYRLHEDEPVMRANQPAKAGASSMK